MYTPPWNARETWKNNFLTIYSFLSSGKFIVKRVNTTRAAATSTCWRKKISRYNSVQEYVIRRIRLSIKDKEREREGSCRREIWKVFPPLSLLLSRSFTRKESRSVTKVAGLVRITTRNGRCPCNESFTSRFITAVLHNRKETRYRKDTRRFDSEWRANDDTGPFVLLNLKRERVPSPLHCSHDPLYKFQNGE